MPKSFKADINPALQFISPQEEPPRAEEQPTHQSAEPIPEGYRINPMYIEKKTRRVQFLLKPSLFDKIKAEAVEKNVSTNEMIHLIIEKYFDN